MMSIKAGLLEYIKEVMKDSDGCYSSKRLLTFAAFILISIAFLGNMFGGYMVSQYIFNAMSTVVMAGVASTVGERFAVAWIDRVKAANEGVSTPSTQINVNQPAQPDPKGEG